MAIRIKRNVEFNLLATFDPSFDRQTVKAMIYNTANKAIKIEPTGTNTVDSETHSTEFHFSAEATKSLEEGLASLDIYKVDGTTATWMATAEKFATVMDVSVSDNSNS